MSVCLVTGAAGFLGFHLCERLLSEGHQVVGVDNTARLPITIWGLDERHLAHILHFHSIARGDGVRWV